MSPAADSAGQPFEGRRFQPNPFAGDDGSADPSVVEALDALHQLAANLPETRPYGRLAEAWTALIDALQGARVLSPLVAEAGDYGVTEQGLVVEKTQELSVIHVEGPDGRPVAPVFLDVTAMTSWRSEARPIPVAASTAALAAAADGLGLLVINPGDDRAIALRRGALQALATGEAYVPAWVDPEVDAAIAQSYQALNPPIRRHRLVPGDPAGQLSGPEVVVALGVEPGLSPSEIESIAATVSVAWSENELLAGRVDGWGIKILPA
jgi:hypothetical protein